MASEPDTMLKQQNIVFKFFKFLPFSFRYKKDKNGFAKWVSNF